MAILPSGRRRRLVCFSPLIVAACLPVAAAKDPVIAGDIEDVNPQSRHLQDVVCDDNTRWTANPWEYLSAQERNAMTVLGWTPATWDAAHPVIPDTTTTTQPARRRLSEAISGAPAASGARPTRFLQDITSTLTTTTTTTFVPASESTCYQGLTEVQRDAVRTLGYSISKWHVCKNPACPWPDGIPRPDDSCADHALYLEAKYNNNVSWFDFTPLVQDALTLLGWSPSMWQDYNKPITYARTWAALFPREREAARFLGYQQRVWDGCMPDTPCLERLEQLESQMRSWQWILTMPVGIRTRLIELGWTQPTWAEGEPPASFRLLWLDLPFEQQVAARLVGFTEDVWNGCPSADCLPRFNYIQRRFNIDWDRMKAAEQRAWLLLEHSKELWTAQGMTGTRAMQARWDELTPEQQAQATFLGHNMETWQGCNTDWTAPATNTSNASQINLGISRTIRMRIVISRPFSEISGNVFGNQVAQLPTSFVELFERSVARALFCGNPPLSPDPQTYVDADGNPLCILTAEYERQRNRVQVMMVTEGSIIVDFIFSGNQTASDTPAPDLFQALRRQLESTTSPLSQDMEFGRFARAATITEIPFSHLTVAEQNEALLFEAKRGVYNSHNWCQLHTDERNGINPCPTAITGGGQRLSAVGTWLLMVATLSLPSRVG